MNSLFFASAGAMCALAHVAGATPVLWTSSNPVAGRSAAALFSTSGTDLVVKLTNTSLVDVTEPVGVLTGVFFDIGGAPLSLGRASAIVPATSTVLFGGTGPGGEVGGEWAYLGGLAGAPRGADYGISSSGLGLFGPGDRFPGANLQGPASPDGLQYGITSAGDDPATGNTPVTGTNALIKNEVIFTLTGLPMGFNPLASIGNVSFQYGTDLSEPNDPGVPTPGALSALALAGLVATRRRR